MIAIFAGLIDLAALGLSLLSARSQVPHTIEGVTKYLSKHLIGVTVNHELATDQQAMEYAV